MAFACELQAVIAKSDIQAITRMRGQVCQDVITSNDVTHPAGSLVLLGFAGSRASDGSYRGVYRFRHVQPADCERNQFVLNELPNAVVHLTRKRTKPPVDKLRPQKRSVADGSNT